MTSQYFKKLLHNRHLKATKQRLKLLVSMQAYASAMPYSAIQKYMESTNRVTLYRTLETLIGQGLIHEAYRENNETYYAICGESCGENHHQHDHIHFKCVRCESVTCQESSDTIQITLPDYAIHKISIHVKGVCPSCLKGEE